MDKLLTLLVFYWLVCALLVAPFTCTSDVRSVPKGPQYYNQQSR